MRVGFVGLGTMGYRMVARLAGAGLPPLVYDALPGAVERAVAAGATGAGDVGAVVAGSDALLTSLPMPADVEAVLTEAAGSARPGQTFVDLSTIDPQTARRIAAALAPLGVDFLDAPVSGGPAGAAEGTLAIMAGGDGGALERVRPALAALSARVFHVGPVGAGSVVKLANQLLVGAGTVAAMEAATFAARAGIAPQTLLEVLSASAGDSVMLRRSLRDFVIPRDFTPAFAMRLLVKDLRLYSREAGGMGSATPAGSPALALFEQGLTAGLGELDYAAILELIERTTSP